jgi:hypothetical protein
MDTDERNLIDYVDLSLNDEEEFHFLRFEFLQRLNIVNLQVDLIRLKSHFQQERKASAHELEILKTKMQDYGKKSNADCILNW